MIVAESPFATGWKARLSLDYAAVGQRTTLVRREHFGPLRVQKSLYPEGDAVCHTIILHPPGGIAAGDSLEFNATLGAESRALITTPGAGKWYKSFGIPATQTLAFNVADGAVLEWLPQEAIVFKGAIANMHTRVELNDDGAYLGWEITCLGRTASGEKFDVGRLRQVSEIYKNGKRIWGEYSLLEGGSPLLQSPVGLTGYSVTATFLVAGKKISPELLALCRTITGKPDERCGITILPEMMAIRFLGNSAEQAKQYFEKIWHLLRPAITGLNACVPRIWRT